MDDLISDVQQFLNNPKRPDPRQPKPHVLSGYVVRWCASCGPAIIPGGSTREAEKTCRECGGQTVAWARRFGEGSGNA